jgi:hypothetical protein
LFLIISLAAVTMQLALAQGLNMTFPRAFKAGNSFSIQSSGNGKATLYIIGPGQVLKRDVQLGEMIFFQSASLSNSGHYLAVLVAGSEKKSGTFDIVPSSQPAELSFLAKPSRLPVDLKGGITGAVYVFDAYHNLIYTPALVSFELSSPGGSMQTKVLLTHDGAAWTGMDSTALQGTDRFVARMGDVSETRLVQQVPGDPCGLKMSAQQSGQQIQLATETVYDCRGNPVTDGTIVTFTESYHGTLWTVDVPIKRGFAEVEMPSINGAAISVASGIVLGNQIEWKR